MSTTAHHTRFSDNSIHFALKLRMARGRWFYTITFLVDASHINSMRLGQKKKQLTHNERRWSASASQFFKVQHSDDRRVPKKIIDLLFPHRIMRYGLWFTLVHRTESLRHKSSKQCEHIRDADNMESWKVWMVEKKTPSRRKNGTFIPSIKVKLSVFLWHLHRFLLFWSPNTYCVHVRGCWRRHFP